MNPRAEHRHQVLVIGSGFGGLFTAQHLAKADVDVTLVARTTTHLFQPLLYQVATGILSEGEIAPSTREVLSGQRNARVLLGEVTAIDLADHRVDAVALGEYASYHYDSLVVAAGSQQSYFGHHEFAEFAPGLKSIDDALELRSRIFNAFELAELAAGRGNVEEVRRQLTFVVVGAGATGVEMAGQIAELSHRTLRRDFRSIDPASARIILLDAADSVLASFGDHLGSKAVRRLNKLGVEVQLGAMVVAVDDEGIEVKDKNGQQRRIDAVCKVWAAGVQASGLGRSLGEQTGAEVDRSGRVHVNADLTLPGHAEVYIVGDMIALDDLPGVAQVAIQSAKHAAGQITRRLEGRPTGQPFRYFDKGSMATVSRFSAVASIGPLRLSGFVAWAAWLGVHLWYIIGFKSRVTTLLHWAVSFLGRGRSERTVTEQQLRARNALNRLGRIEAERRESTTPPAAN